MTLPRREPQTNTSPPAIMEDSASTSPMTTMVPGWRTVDERTLRLTYSGGIFCKGSLDEPAPGESAPDSASATTVTPVRHGWNGGMETRWTRARGRDRSIRAPRKRDRLGVDACAVTAAGTTAAAIKPWPRMAHGSSLGAAACPTN